MSEIPHLKCVVDATGAVKKFTDIEISTKTVIAITNLKIDLPKFFQYIPITDHVPPQKRRGRKPRVSLTVPTNKISAGSVIFAQTRREFRGSYVKEKTKNSKTFFLHSVTVVLVLKNNKFVNVKVSGNGKLQITGCKCEEHYVDTVVALFEILRQIQEMTGEKVYRLANDDQNVTAVYNTVMQNMDFNIGFHIYRHKLDRFIKQSTPFHSIFEGSIAGTGVNIKIPSDETVQNDLLRISYNPENFALEKTLVPYSNYCDLLEDKEKRKEWAKKRCHTFLVFSSGSIIMSSRGSDMATVFNTLVTTLLENRQTFEDTSEW
jgi:hypothetical protein